MCVCVRASARVVCVVCLRMCARACYVCEKSECESFKGERKKIVASFGIRLVKPESRLQSSQNKWMRAEEKRMVRQTRAKALLKELGEEKV